MAAILLRRRNLGKSSCHGIRKQGGQAYKVCRNDIRNRRGYPPGYNVLFRWGCTDVIPEDRFDFIVNTAAAIQAVNDKRGFRRALMNHNPELVPRTWFNNADPEILYPCIVRPTHHAQGRRLFVCNNRAELDDAWRRCNGAGYISELINKVAEYRIFVVQGRVANVARKTPGNPNQVAWNVAQGGRFDNVRWDDWPLQAVRKAVEAFEVSGLDFAGVDVMVDNNQSYVIEINSAPSLPNNQDGTPTHRQECMAKCFDWILQRGKAKIPMTTDRGGYKKFIHPAICDEAIIGEN